MKSDKGKKREPDLNDRLAFATALLIFGKTIAEIVIAIVN